MGKQGKKSHEYTGDILPHMVRTYHKRSMLFAFVAILMICILLMGRLVYLMIFQAEHFGVLAREIQERERSIKAERGRILDCNGVELASNKPVSTISVIHSQIKEPERVIQVLAKELGIEEESVRKRVEKRSSIERVKTNVDKEIADKIRS